MMDRKWTPGPWVNTIDSGEIASHDGTYIGRAVLAITSEGRANARLMAAAPEMYEVLQLVLSTISKSDYWWMDCPDKGGFDVEKITAALAAARGEK